MKFERMATKRLPDRDPNPENWDLNRRGFLILEGALAVAGAAATTGVVKLATKSEGTPVKEKPHDHLAFIREEVKVESTEHDPNWWQTRTYQVPRELVGNNINSLEMSYVRPIDEELLPQKDPQQPHMRAFPEVFPPIDFAGNLERMTEKKMELARDAGAPDMHEQQETFDRLAHDYREKRNAGEIRRMDLKEFRGLIEEQVYGLLQELSQNYERIAEVYLKPALEKNDGATDEWVAETMKQFPQYLDMLAKRITPDLLMTYMAVELMPSRERSAALLEFMTKNAGVEYLETIPALGDRHLSYGPFQLTKFVIGKGGGEGHDNDNEYGKGSVTQLLEVMGATVLVPNELKDFKRIEDHLRAGYLFAFYNMLTLVQDAVKHGRFEELMPIADSAQNSTMMGSSTVFLEHVSAAHHNPKIARKTMKHWLEQNCERDKYSRDKSLLAYFPDSHEGQEVRTYAEKAKAISTVLRTYLHS